jgi:hypothetical protein
MLRFVAVPFLDLRFPFTNVYITNQFQTCLLGGGGGEGVKSVSRGDCEKQKRRNTLETVVPITSKNSASGAELGAVRAVCRHPTEVPQLLENRFLFLIHILK